MKNGAKAVLKSITLVMLLLCTTAAWFYLEMWLPHRTIYNSRQFDLEEDYRARKKVRVACHKVLSHRIGNHHDAFITIQYVGNKDSIPYLIRALKRLEARYPQEVADKKFGLCTFGHCRSSLEKLTGMEFGWDNKACEMWWEQTGRHLPFDEKKGQLISQNLQQPEGLNK